MVNPDQVLGAIHKHIRVTESTRMLCKLRWSADQACAVVMKQALLRDLEKRWCCSAVMISSEKVFAHLSHTYGIHKSRHET